MTTRSTLPLHIEILQGGTVMQVVQADQPLVQIGSLASCPVRIQDPQVARVHAMIENQGTSGVFLVDLGSIQGTWVNDQPVERTQLQHGDKIRIGNTILVVRFGQPTKSPSIPSSTSSAQVHVGRANVQFRSGTPAESVELTSFFEGAVLDRQILLHPGQSISKKWGWVLLGISVSSFVVFGLLVRSVYLQAIAAEKWAHLAQQTLAGAGRLQVEVSVGLPLTIFTVFSGVVGLLTLISSLVLIAGQRKKSDYTIGLDPKADFPSPEALPMSNFPLVRSTQTHHEVLITPSMTGGIQLGGVSFSLAQAIQQGIAQPTVLPHVYAIPIYQASSIAIQLGPNRFLINAAPKQEERMPISILIAWAGLGSIFMAFLLFLFVMWLVPVRFVSGVFINPKLQRETDKQIEALDPEVILVQGAGKEGGPKGAEGQRAKGEEGKMGDRNSKKTDGKAALKGDAQVPKWTAEQVGQAASDAAANVGPLGLIRSSGGIAIGGGPALGSDARDALGNSREGEVGDAYGNGGLGGVGTGPGGGGTGDGTIGLGNLNTTGRGAGGNGGGKYGSGGATAMTRKAGVPTIETSTPNVKGNLDRELIKRVIRRHINEIKFCYEKSLVRNPGIEGRAMVSFTIGTNGSVVASSMQSSSLKHPETEACMVQAVRRWEFPKPQNGIVMITYPFVLRPSE